MTLHFDKLDLTIGRFLKLLVGYLEDNDSLDIRKRCALLADQIDLWGGSSEQAVLVNELMSQVEVDQVSQLVDKILSDILPTPELAENIPNFLPTLNTWITRLWLHQFGRKFYYQQFDMILEFFARVLAPYDLKSGKRFENIVEQFTERLTASLNRSISTEELERLQVSLTDIFSDFVSSSKRFEAKVTEFEKQKYKNKSASALAEQLVFQVMSGRTIPSWSYPFLTEQWPRLLHLLLLQYATEDSEVKSAVATLNQLAEALEVNSAEEVKELMVSRLMPLRQSIRDVFLQVAIDQAMIERFLQSLEDYHVGIIECNDSELVNTSEDDFYSWPEVDSADNLNVANQHVKPLPHTTPGSWYHLLVAQQPIKAKIIDRNLFMGYLVFANYSGVRVDSLTFAEFSSLLEEKRVTRLPLDSGLAAVITEIDKLVIGNTKSLKNKIDCAQQDAKSEQLRLQRQQKEQLEIAEREQRRLIEQQAIKLRREQHMQADRDDKVKQLLSMTKGAKFLEHNNHDRIVKFVVRIKQTGNMIFVDEHGVKVGDWSIDELANRWVQAEIELIGTGDKKLSTMEQIVATQRDRRQGAG
ncbi:MAG: DUF1631 family protein [Kangiellaceae bacterium]|jgi:hypothetical protein|nr:DUF1631 family protein [Kangiellaceae bacterium]